ncbi:hypothetical protein [Rubritalea profundi]|uniref:Uncharacterized protein n=1 Tax=Rubritalea profundi TaxID=1658618 RepID=A0A2S7TYU7_9BACT|nr:hypothetical protein [Rubritalea profundi]PQJ27925.1 hypothetical protein BSZ32_05025 [Rubritalea profundi]
MKKILPILAILTTLAPLVSARSATCQPEASGAKNPYTGKRSIRYIVPVLRDGEVYAVKRGKVLILTRARAARYGAKVFEDRKTAFSYAKKTKR